MSVTTSPVVRVLCSPSQAAPVSPAGWDLLVRQARRAGLLPRVAQALHDAGVQAPVEVQRHLDVGRSLALVQRDEVLREVKLLMQTLQPLHVPVVLLKGAAYVAAGLPPSRARLFADIDILVPHGRLGEVEARLMTQGWVTTHLSAYDQRYYRRWMHELPPMVHTRRGTSLDIHHNILPLTSRTPPDPRLLLDHAVPVDGLAGALVLSPPDMVLHSLVHLFHNEETSHALRDLSDIDLLLRHWQHAAGFWPLLVSRARHLQASAILGCALRQAKRVFATPVPDDVLAATADSTAAWRRHLHDALWSRAFAPRHPSCDGPAAVAARAALYLRAHWLRMPPALLARHLAVKALGLNRLPAPRPARGPAHGA